jgi:hypothetical protein
MTTSVSGAVCKLPRPRDFRYPTRGTDAGCLTDIPTTNDPLVGFFWPDLPNKTEMF